MRKIFVFSSVIAVLIGCERKRDVRILQGYIVYILPDRITFVETKERPNSNYMKNFRNRNFSSAIIFTPSCEIRRQVENIKADTLLDENPEMKEYATFLKRPIIFPAEVMVVDTADRESNGAQEKFKMVLNKREVEFNYTEFKSGIIISIRRSK
jgi:hypothetical protein